MKKLLVPILLLILSVLAAETFPLPVGEFAPRSYTAFRTVEGIKVDGSLTTSTGNLPCPRSCSRISRRPQTSAPSGHLGQDALG